jgi:hypothetical protein
MYTLIQNFFYILFMLLLISIISFLREKMERTIKLAVVAALALCATSAFATNGTKLIGVGAKSRGMGG